MKNKTRDIVVIIISLIIFITAIIFILENMGGKSKEVSSDAQNFDKMEVPSFETDYDEDVLKEVNDLEDSGIPEPTDLGKENIFKKE